LFSPRLIPSAVLVETEIISPQPPEPVPQARPWPVSEAPERLAQGSPELAPELRGQELPALARPEPGLPVSAPQERERQELARPGLAIVARESQTPGLRELA
jgi:hypothetical protein